MNDKRKRDRSGRAFALIPPLSSSLAGLLGLLDGGFYFGHADIMVYHDFYVVPQRNPIKLIKIAI